MQLSLLDYEPRLRKIHFKGESYHPGFDCARLNNQMKRVHEAMKDRRWRTLREIEAITGDGQASISARLRDYSSNEYLSQHFVKQRQRRGDPKLGIFEYRILPRNEA